jgi:hypothetical protein
VAVGLGLGSASARATSCVWTALRAAKGEVEASRRPSSASADTMLASLKIGILRNAEASVAESSVVNSCFVG